MTIIEHAAAALARARATGTPVLAVESAHVRRVRAALARDVAAMLGVPPAHVVVTADPLRGYGSGGFPGHLIIVHDPDDPATIYRFIPETGNSGGGGGSYLLLGECPGCGGRADDTAPGAGKESRWCRWRASPGSPTSACTWSGHARSAPKSPAPTTTATTGTAPRCRSNSSTTPDTRPTAHCADRRSRFGAGQVPALGRDAAR
jgi:hypothetical protein